MDLLQKTLKFGLLMFIPFALVAFYFSGYFCSDEKSLVSNCSYYQIIFTVVAPFVLSFLVQYINIYFNKSKNNSIDSKVTKKVSRVFAVFISIFVFLLSMSYISYSVYPDTSNFMNTTSVLISALIGILVFMGLSKK